MPSDTATDAARAILEDRRGADYYKDPEILAKFLEGKLGVRREDAAKTAKAILDDRSGADYYKDPKILAELLDGELRSA
jgi:hypothetical protein